MTPMVKISVKTHRNNISSRLLEILMGAKKKPLT